MGRGGSQLRRRAVFQAVFWSQISSQASLQSPVTWRAWEAFLRYCVRLQAVFVFSWLSWKVTPERFAVGLECKIL